MPETAPTPMAPAPNAGPEPQQQTPPTPTPPDPAATAQVEGFKSEESKTAVLADLAKERDARQALEKQLGELRDAQQAQTKALADAFGLSEAPKSEDLAETVKHLQQQIATDRYEALKARLAAEHGVDAQHMDLLTETDTEKLQAQAVKVGALLGAQKPGEQTPAFQTNPGQGRGGQGDPTAADNAEYERYFPPPKK